jgi:predicted branched-subunit amino acid permease
MLREQIKALVSSRAPPGAAEAQDAGAAAGYRAGARAVLPIALAIAVPGAAFGALAASAGLSAGAAAVMSATTFAGSAQFAAVSIFAAGGTLPAAVAAASLLNARYAAMGLALSRSLGAGRWLRFLLAQLAVDESWAVAHLGEGRFSRERLVGAGAVLFAAHVSSTLAGAVAGGTILRDAAKWGLDAAFPALFVILLWPNLRRRDGLVAATAGAAIALALTPFAPPGIAVLAGAAPALLAARRQ